MRVDYLGNATFIASICAVLFGLITGGTMHPWSSWRVILPLVLGAVGWICFHIHQKWFWKEPSIPPHLLGNPTGHLASDLFSASRRQCCSYGSSTFSHYISKQCLEYLHCEPMSTSCPTRHSSCRSEWRLAESCPRQANSSPCTG